MMTKIGSQELLFDHLKMQIPEYSLSKFYILDYY